jgi:hypothetical protein
MMDTVDQLPEVREPATSRGWLLVPLFLLAGYLLFAHGCHGDEDHELFMKGGRSPDFRLASGKVEKAEGREGEAPAEP